ncbi:MAG: phospho-N-acetylmuramoyl-pentapeptide-transferase [Anaerolineales bacterium]|nr:phospho-N-acetylmuramoyl-pentapeptide-transferase [Anaerolineales bacterium]
MKDATIALALAGLTFLITVIWGGPLIIILRRFRIGKQIRIDEPQHHQTKMGTPTMGGMMIVVPVLLISLLLNVVNLVRGNTSGRSILLPLAVLTAYTLLGAWDDWLGLSGVARGEGMRGRSLLFWQSLLALGAALGLYFVLGIDTLALPGVPFYYDLGLFYIPVAMFVIVGGSNAINLTDGLDGLAGLLSATAFAAYGVIALLQGQVFLVRFCFTLVGALFAFLWFNAHPAELFMGGSGSYSLGATLGVVALMTGQWVLLPLIIIMPISVALSVIIQVGYFKLTRRLTGQGKRVFKMSPLHLHFELLGWSETQVVQRFWLVGLLAAMVGVGLALL